MEMKPGYKQTEVGVIPEDWEVRPLGLVAAYTNGKAHEGWISDRGKYIVVNSKFISTNGEIRKYSAHRFSPASKGDILMVMSDVPNGRAIARCFFGAARYITFMNVMTNIVIDCGTFECVHIKPTESQNRVAKGDLFFNGSSETPEEVGMYSVLAQDVQDVFLNSFCFGFRFRDEACADGLYLAYFFRSREGRELLKTLSQGATRYNLSKTALLKVAFPLPQLPEQTAIAAILSDMDAELAAVEARLAKTRNIKQGMMQELLTGRIRLV